MKKIFSKFIGFILSPFVKIIRYGALKLMKKFYRPGDRRPAMAAADHMLDEIILLSVFRTFQEDKFRELANFKKLPISEHDRIFNELEVAGMCMAVFYLETAKNFVRDGEFHFWRDVEEELPRQLQKKLVGFGVSSSDGKLMKQLIDMRYKEYNELAEQILRADTTISSEFKNKPPEIKRLMGMAQAIAVGTADHIRRGKLEEKDSLIKHLVLWLIKLQKRIDRFLKRL